MATAAKDRTGLFDGAHWVPVKATGEALRGWLDSGVDITDASRQQLDKLKAHVVTIDNVPHLNSWWRANAADIERMLPPHVDALKAVYAERRTAILDALRAQQAAVTGRPRRGQAAASAAH